jgi:hypothetical protein
MRLHANRGCQHGDSAVFKMRRSFLANDLRGVLQEVSRIRERGEALDEFEKMLVAVHEVDAMFVLDIIFVSEYLGTIDSFTEVCRGLNDHGAIADINTWYTWRLVAKGYLEQAQALAETRFAGLRQEPSVRAYHNTTFALIAAGRGDNAGAIELYKSALLHVGRIDFPCEYEFIARQLARSYWPNDPQAARQVLHQADIPEGDAEKVLASFG